MAMYADSKKRPPPIDVPNISYPALARPGPNAFAAAAQAKKSENVKQHESTGLQDASVRLPRSASIKSASSKSRESESTTATSLMDRARGLSVPATGRRHRATQSSPNAILPTKQQEQSLEEDSRTRRAKLEAETERKYHKMMGQIPSTPTKGVQAIGSELHYQVNDLRARVSIVSKSSTSEGSDRAKSPKKKLFGVSLPSFKMSSSRPASASPPPPMPEKITKVLGSSPPLTKGRNKFPYSNRSLPSSAGSRSAGISKVVPPNAYRQHAQYNRSYHRRPVIHPGDSTYPRRRASNGKPSRKDRVSVEHTPTASLVRSSSSESAGAPTPPQKDTPPGGGYSSAVQQISSMVNTVPVEPTPGRKDTIDHGMKLHFPTLFALDPSSKPQLACSPTKYCPWGAEDYAKIVEREHIKSEYGAVDHTSIESPPACNQSREEVEDAYGDEDTNTMAPLETSLPAPSQRPIDPLFFSVEADPHPGYLPATTYQLTPPGIFHMANVGGSVGAKMDADGLPPTLLSRAEKTHPPFWSAQDTFDSSSQQPIHERNRPPQAAIAIQTASGNSASPRRSEHHSGPEMTQFEKQGFQAAHPHLPRFHVDDRRVQPENSSSQLTDMLSAASPSKVEFHEFHEFQPHSAVPSPLHRNDARPRFLPTTRVKDHSVFFSNALKNANNFSRTHASVVEVGQKEESKETDQLQSIHRGSNEPTHTDLMMAGMKQAMNEPRVRSPSINSSMPEHVDAGHKHTYAGPWAEYGKKTKGANDGSEETLFHEAHRSAMLENRLAVMEAQFEDLKAQIRSTGRKADGEPNQMEKMAGQLDKLCEFVKSGIAEPLRIHMHRCVNMERDIRGLCGVVQELQQTMERRTPLSAERPALQSSPYHGPLSSSCGDGGYGRYNPSPSKKEMYSSHPGAK